MEMEGEGEKTTFRKIRVAYRLITRTRNFVKNI